MLSADPVNPMRVVWELSERLPADAIVAGRLRLVDQLVRPLLAVPRPTARLAVRDAGHHGARRCPYAIGAKYAHPDRPVIALVGDGAMQMNGLAELLTIARYWRQWTDPRLVVCVFHNNDLTHVTWELRAMGGAPKFEESQTLPDVSYADVARTMGLRAIAVDDARRGRHRRGSRRWPPTEPVLLDVRTDPEVPPIPPHVTLRRDRSR